MDEQEIYEEIGNYRTKLYHLIRKYETQMPIEQALWEKNPNKITWDQLTPHDYEVMGKDWGL